MLIGFVGALKALDFPFSFWACALWIRWCPFVELKASARNNRIAAGETPHAFLKMFILRNFLTAWLSRRSALLFTLICQACTAYVPLLCSTTSRALFFIYFLTFFFFCVRVFVFFCPSSRFCLSFLCVVFVFFSSFRRFGYSSFPIPLCSFCLSVQGGLGAGSN